MIMDVSCLCARKILTYVQRRVGVAAGPSAAFGLGGYRYLARTGKRDLLLVLIYPRQLVPKIDVD